MSPNVHKRWQSLVNALRLSGVTAELDPNTLHRRIGGRASRPPEPRAFISLLESYFKGDGDQSQGLRRRQAARLIIQHGTDETAAKILVIRLSLAALELGDVRLMSHGSARAISLWADGVATVIPETDIIIDRVLINGVAHTRRSVSVRGLIAAMNRLLAMRGLPFRFVQLMTPEGVEAYVGVSALDAALLERGGALELVGDDLDELTCWGSSTSYPPYKSVA